MDMALREGRDKLTMSRSRRHETQWDPPPRAARRHAAGHLVVSHRRNLSYVSVRLRYTEGR
jgi:hypothetical protein